MKVINGAIKAIYTLDAQQINDIIFLDKAKIVIGETASSHVYVTNVHVSEVQGLRGN